RFPLRRSQSSTEPYTLAVASVLPSGLKARDWIISGPPSVGSSMEDSCPSRERRRRPVAASHALTQPSAGLPTVSTYPPPTATFLPSGLNTTALAYPGFFSSSALAYPGFSPSPSRGGRPFPLDGFSSIRHVASVLSPGL